MDTKSLARTSRKAPKARQCVKIVVAAPKGGVGKTTLIMALLVCSAKAGMRGIGINMDEQPSLTSWGGFRERQRKSLEGESIEPLTIVERRLDDDRAVFEEIEGRYQVAFLDTPPGHTHYQQAVHRLCERADLILIPTSASDVDLDEVIRFRLNLPAGGERAVFVLNAVNRRASSYLKARNRLLKAGRLCPADVPRLEIIHGQFKAGLASPDLGDKGADDFEAVWSFVRQELAI